MSTLEQLQRERRHLRDRVTKLKGILKSSEVRNEGDFIRERIATNLKRINQINSYLKLRRSFKLLPGGRHQCFPSHQSTAQLRRI